MPSFTNTLGARSRRSQWRFRQILRTRDASGRLDISSAGLLDFTGCTEILLTVTPREPRALHWFGWWDGCGGCLGELPPILTASMTAGTLFVSNPGLVEAVFPAGTLLAFPRGFYDVRIAVTAGGETEEIFDEPVEFA